MSKRQAPSLISEAEERTKQLIDEILSDQRVFRKQAVEESQKQRDAKLQLARTNKLDERAKATTLELTQSHETVDLMQYDMSERGYDRFVSRRVNVAIKEDKPHVLSHTKGKYKKKLMMKLYKTLASTCMLLFLITYYNAQGIAMVKETPTEEFRFTQQ
ncbi:unnamed protein product, partial [Mesorhabditis spiculigera]